MLTPEALIEAHTKLHKDTPEAKDAAVLLLRHHKDANQIDSTLCYIRKVIKAGNDHNAPAVLALGYVELAEYFLVQDRQDSIFYFLDKVIALSDHIDDKPVATAIARANIIYAAMYDKNMLGEEELFSYLKRAIEISEKYEIPHLFIHSNILIAGKYVNKEKYDKVEAILSESYSFLERLDQKEEDYLYRLDKLKASYLARVDTTKEGRKEALDLMMSAYKYAESKGDKIKIAVSFLTLTTNFRDDISKTYFLELSEKVYHDTKDYVGSSLKGGLLSTYGKALMVNKEYEKSIPVLIEAKEYLIESTNISNYLDACDLLTQAYSSTGQYQKIESEFEDYKAFQDKYIATVYSDKLLDLEEKYETEKKEFKNIQLSNQNALYQNRSQYLLVIGLLLLSLLILSFLLFLKMIKNKKRLESLNADKNKLFAILAHDLRNPIASLSNLSAKVRLLAKNNLLSELEEMTKQSDSRLVALSDNLNNILLWAIRESNIVELNPEPVLLRSEIDKINHIYSDAVSQKNLIIINKVAPDSCVYTDAKVLQAIIRNLTSNAIKFSFGGGVIEFSTAVENSNFELRISDGGLGLKEINAEHESDANQRLRKASEGSGVGLKICKELAIRSGLQLGLIPNKSGGTIGVIKFDNIHQCN